MDQLHTVVRGWLVNLPTHQCLIPAQVHEVLEFLLPTLILFDCPSGEKSGRVSCSATKPDNSGSPSFVAMTQTQAWTGSLASHTLFRKSKVKVQTHSQLLCCVAMSRVVATYLQRRNLFFLLSRLRGGERLGMRLLEWPGVLQPSTEGTTPRELACGRPLHSGVCRTAATEGVPEDDVVPLPKYTPRVGEDERRKRARLLYQSR